MANAATQVSGLELGGLFGSLSSGAISDHLVRSNDGSKGNVGLRVQARHAPHNPGNFFSMHLASVFFSTTSFVAPFEVQTVC